MKEEDKEFRDLSAANTDVFPMKKVPYEYVLLEVTLSRDLHTNSLTSGFAKWFFALLISRPNQIMLPQAFS